MSARGTRLSWLRSREICGQVLVRRRKKLKKPAVLVGLFPYPCSSITDAGSSSPCTKMNPIAVPESWYISQLTRAVCNGIVRREGLAAIWPGAARSSDEVPQNLKQALLN